MTIIRLATILVLFLPLTTPLVAQDTLVAAEGTQVATQETPAAATNAEELRKQSQNPVSNLISVPIQETLEFQCRAGRTHSECCEPPASDSFQRVEKLEPHHPLDHADHLPASSRAPATRAPVAKDRCVRLGRPEPFILSLAEEEQSDLGRRTDFSAAYSEQYDLSRAGETQHRAVGGRAGAALAFYDRVSYQQLLVCRRSFQFQ